MPRSRIQRISAIRRRDRRGRLRTPAPADRNGRGGRHPPRRPVRLRTARGGGVRLVLLSVERPAAAAALRRPARRSGVSARGTAAFRPPDGDRPLPPLRTLPTDRRTAAARGGHRLLAGRLWTHRRTRGGPPAMERRPHLDELGPLRLPRRGRRTPSRQPAARLPVSLRLRLRPAPERRLPPEQRHPADRSADQQRPHVLEHHGQEPRRARGAFRSRKSLPAGALPHSRPHISPLPAGPPLPASGQEAEALATAHRVADHTPKIESAQTRKMQEEMRGLLAAARSGPLSETQEP